MDLQKKEIDDERKKIKRRLAAANKKQVSSPEKQNNTTVVEESKEDDSGFKRPELPSSKLREAEEQEKIFKLQVDNMKKELIELEKQENVLSSKKSSLIRFQKLMSDTSSSRFLSNGRDAPVLNDRYVCIEMLGKGGFSEVYKAFDLHQLRYVACKVHQLNPAWSEERKKGYTKHATREYNIHKMMQHRRVVQLYDVFALDVNSFCTVLEYCDGPDLDLYLKTKHQLSEREAQIIMMQVFSGLKYFSEQPQPIIHYDLKPGNILFNKG